MRGLQPMHNLQGMPEGRPGADPGGTGSASAGTPAEHRMKGAAQVGQASWPVPLRAALGAFCGGASCQPPRCCPPGVRGASPPRRRLPACPTRTRVQCHCWLQLSCLVPLLLLCLSFLPTLHAQAIPYSRPVETAPQAETIGGGYKTPAVQKPLPRDAGFQVLDVLLLAAAMGISVWLVLKRRSRKWAVALTIGSRAHFRFFCEGCIFPPRAVQKVGG